ncbi:MAG: SDR family oxidoreductase [Chloroflexota bacterium]
MTQTILVTGGTGALGRAVVKRLLDSGREVRVLSRRPRPTDEHMPYTWMTGDLRSGEGLDRAVAGADSIVPCASGPRGDVEAARNLIAAAQRAGSPYVIYISIVGIDQVPLGYYREKLEVERLIERSGLPWTVLRATQFHDLILRACTMLARPPVMVVPAGTSFQSIDVGEVAGRLAALATGTSAGRVPDIGGPEVRSTGDLARAYLRASGRHRPVLPVRIPGAVFVGYRRGDHLARDRAIGRVTFEDFLDERMTSASDSQSKTGQ